MRTHPFKFILTSNTDINSTQYYMYRRFFMLKRFAETDFDASVDMFYNIFTNPPWGFDWMSRNHVYEYFVDILNTPKTIAYTYFNESGLCGGCFGSVSYCSPIPIYEIKEIFIKNEYHNKGLGSKMLAEIETDLKKYGITAIRLFTMRTIPAFGFYIKNGYEETADAVTLSKIL